MARTGLVWRSLWGRARPVGLRENGVAWRTMVTQSFSLSRAVRLGAGGLLVFLSAIFLPGRAAGQLLTQHTATLQGDTDQTYSNIFGASVSLSGNRVAVGTSANKQVYVFTRGTNGGWTRQSRINATFPNSMSSAVSLDGDTLVIANEIYVWNGTAWTLQFTLPPNRYSLALQGDT